MTREGGQEGFGEVFAAHHRDAYRLALLLCGDATAAEDVVADAFAAVYPRWLEGRVERVGPYLRQAVVNQFRSRLRRRALERREQDRRRGDDRGSLAADDRAASTDAVRRALAALSPGQRAVVVLRYYDDLPEAEIARLLGMRVGTVKSHLSRGLARLRPLLDEPEPDSGGQR